MRVYVTFAVRDRRKGREAISRVESKLKELGISLSSSSIVDDPTVDGEEEMGPAEPIPGQDQML